MESDESPENYAFLTDRAFPIELQSQGRKRTLRSWEDFSTLIEECPTGLGEFAWVRSWHVLPEKKSIALSSFVNPMVAPYFVMYAQAIADYTYGYLFDGKYGAQPSVLMESFALIRSFVAEVERKARQSLIRESRLAREKMNNG